MIRVNGTLNKITNIASPFQLKVIEIVEIIEQEINKKAKVIIENRGGSYSIDNTDIQDIIERKKIFGGNYPQKVVRLYIKSQRVV